MSNDIGESVASINRRMDANAWPRVYCALTRGAMLVRPQGLNKYFTKCKSDLDEDHEIGISAAFVKFQAEHGCLVRIGVDVYGIEESRLEKPQIETPVQPVQMGLF